MLLRNNGINQRGQKERSQVYLEDLIKEYEEKSNQKEVIEVLENLQWGDSSFIREVLEDAKNKYSISLTSAHISRAITENFNTPFFRSLPDLKKIKDFSVSSSIIKGLMNEVEANHLAKSIAKNTVFLSEKEIITGSLTFHKK